MPLPGDDSLRGVLTRLAEFRQRANLTADAVEQQMLLGPGWIERFESGLTVPPLDMLLVLLKKYGREPSELFAGVTVAQHRDEVIRGVFAEPDVDDLLIRFTYAQFDATYRLKSATTEQFSAVIKSLRDGLAKLTGLEAESEAVKADSVANAFLKATATWPHANPSDLWWFVIYRAHFDPFNHPAVYARLDFGQSWKRTGGWALEEVLVRHYGPFLRNNGIDLYIATADEKRDLAKFFKVRGRVETDKIDVVIAGLLADGQRLPFGVVHVKASFAERRTDDVPLSNALVEAGYTSPLWTLDCKSTPAAMPINKGELGVSRQPGEDTRSAKRKDIEDDGYFSACFSYNRNTVPTPTKQKCKARIYCCDCSRPLCETW